MHGAKGTIGLPLLCKMYTDNSLRAMAFGTE
jgi:hypothetical protein